ncbi:tRNA lysidine(34) synthetase TilS [Aquimarina sp. W85]|uniref:tRNA lysidine(34) synthetase TilS n=1 Tax=Aquimarina rhodophyticola TaxID=3342246 RepID=UPI00366B1B2F
MLADFKKHLETNFSFLYKERFLIACSGGLDSMVLVHLCRGLNLDFGVLHCNFKLRAVDSDTDEHFVVEQAGILEVPVYTIEFDTERYAQNHKLSIQLAARTLRYKWFKKMAIQHAYPYVLTAHHVDDVLETFLINLSRGTGLEGLTGIPEKNDIFIRPLLPFSRIEIESYAKNKLIAWREDASNQNTKYLRNQFRQLVIPELKGTNERFLKNFETTRIQLNKSQLFIEAEAQRIKELLFETQDNGEIHISISKLLNYGDPKIYLYFILKDFGFTAWSDIAKLINSQSGKQVFSPTHRILKDRNLLIISSLTLKKVPVKTYRIEKEETTVMVPIGTLHFKNANAIESTEKNTIYIDQEKLKYPLTVRKWEKGDYFYPIGMKGKKKLSKYFKDEKLSLLDKERAWILCSGSDIVWIINYRADDRFKILSNTNQLLKITLAT